MIDTNLVKRVLYGYVVQLYDKDTGECVDQEFFYDGTEWEDHEGESIDEPGNYKECSAIMLQPRDIEED